MESPTPQPPAPRTTKPMTLALACAGLGLVAGMTLLFAKLPPVYSVWNASVIGALALFTAARLGFWRGIIFTAVAISLKDLCLYLSTPWWEPYPLSWLYFSGYALVGWALLRRSSSVLWPTTTGLGAGLLFFLISNFVSWLEQAQPYGYSLTGLLDCYSSAIPFYRGTLLGDVLFTAVLFGAHLALSHAYFRQERVAIPVEGERGA